MAEKRFSNSISIRNKQATFQYEIIEKVVAGIVLQGTEVKSIREGKVNLQDGHCYFNKGEAWVRGITITPYSQGTHYNHEADRERKLLLKKTELKRLEAKVSEKGLALIPVRLFINDKGLAKLELGLGRGKKLHDKRESIKERDVKRELSRVKF